jgi:hypothetical protein
LVHALPSAEDSTVWSNGLVTGIGSSGKISETVALPARAVTGLPDGR